MNSNEPTRQQLWELVYDLLPAAEAAELSERIGSDPELARAYATVKQQAETLGRAARLDGPPLEFRYPPEDAAANDPPTGPKAVAATRRWFTAVPQALVALAATLLCGFLGYAAFRLRTPDAARSPLAEVQVSASPPVIRTTLTTPDHLHRDIQNPILARTVSMEGQPVPAEVEVRVLDMEGQLRWRQRARAGPDGVSRFALRGRDLPASARVEARPVGQTQPAASADVEVVTGRSSTYLVVDKPIYRPGEDVLFRSVTLSNFDLQAADQDPVEYQIQDAAGRVVAGSALVSETDQGVGSGAFALPTDASAGKYMLVAESANARPARRVFHVQSRYDGETPETAADQTPIDQDRFTIEFFPEGGELVRGVPNRVYFHAYDRRGNPVQLEARLLDDAGAEQARIRATHAGRGRFTFTPQQDAAYRVVLDGPVNVDQPPRLPAVSERALAMQMARGVVAVDVPLEVQLYANRPVGPIILLASCRGAVVGLERLERDELLRSDDENYQARTSIRLAPETAGVVRVTAFDYAASPPQPLAERLAFRRPAQKIHVELADLQESYPGGGRVAVSLRTTDEMGNPRSAVLGASIVSEEILQLANDRTPSLPAHFYLVTELRRPEDLEDAKFLLGETAEAEQALDLLLGTHGWRRFVTPSPQQLAETDILMRLSGGASGGSGLLTTVAADESLPRVVEAVAANVRGRRQDTLSAASSERVVRGPQWLARLAGVASAALAVLIVFFVVRRATAGSWLPVISVAVAGLLLVMVTSLTLRQNAGVRIGDLASLDATDALDEAEQGEPPPAERSLPATAESSSAADTTLSWGAKSAADSRLTEGLASDRYAMEPQVEPSRTQPSPADEELAEQRRGLNLGEDFGRPTVDDSTGKQAQESATPNAALGVEALLDVEEESATTAARSRPLTERAIRTERLDAQAAASPPSRPQPTAREYAAFGLTPIPQLNPKTSDAANETIFWQPLLITDAAGRHTLTFNLPAEPTSFRLRADAHADGRLGAVEAPIMVRSK